MTPKRRVLAGTSVSAYDTVTWSLTPAVHRLRPRGEAVPFPVAVDLDGVDVGAGGAQLGARATEAPDLVTPAGGFLEL